MGANVDVNHPAVLLSDKRNGKKRMYVGKQFTGVTFRDCMRKIRDTVIIDAKGYGEFTVQCFSSAV